jgi:hypothetical protein
MANQRDQDHWATGWRPLTPAEEKALRDKERRLDWQGRFMALEYFLTSPMTWVAVSVWLWVAVLYLR